MCILFYKITETSFYNFLVNYKDLLSTIEPFNGTNFPINLMAPSFLTPLKKVINLIIPTYVMRFGHSGLSILTKSMYNMGAELKALGRFISDDLLVHLVASLPENYNKRAQNVDTPVRCKFCESLHQVQKNGNKVVS